MAQSTVAPNLNNENSPLNKPYALLFAMMFVTMLSSIGIAMPYPVLAPLFMDPMAGPITSFAGLPPKLLLAIALAVYPLGLLIGANWMGGLSDVYGRKRVLSISLWISLLGYLISALALWQHHFLAFAVARFLTGLTQGNIAITRALAADLHPHIDKTRSFSWLYATTYAAWLIGPLAGGYLMTYSAATVFVVAAVSTLAAVVLTHALVPADVPNQCGTDKLADVLKKQHAWQLLNDPLMRRVFMIATLLALGLNAFYEFYPLWLVEVFGMSSVGVSHHTAYLTLSMVLVSALVVEPVRRRFGKLPPTLFAVIVFAALLLTAGMINGPLLPVFFALIGVLIGLYNGLLQVYFSDRYGDRRQGQLLGMLTTTFYLSTPVMAVFGGLLSLLGSQWSLFAGGVLLALGAVTLIRFDHSTQPAVGSAASSETR